MKGEIFMFSLLTGAAATTAITAISEGAMLAVSVYLASKKK